MNTIKVYYFASVKDHIKKSYDIIEISTNTFENTQVFLDFIASKYSSIEKELNVLFKNCLISINDTYLEKDEKLVLKNDDELSIIPPISAG